MKPTRILLAALVFLPSVACSDSRPEKVAPPANPGSASATTPIPVAPPAAGLAFTAQEGWVTEKPTSAMRKAQYKLPHAEKDTEDASLVVFYFAGQGGDLQANVDRWCSQFEQPDGKKSADVLKSATRTVNGMTVHDVELSGTYVAETAPGSGQHVRKENWRMLAAILEAKDGPYYAKLVGPSATVARWEESFKAFVSAVKPGS